MLTARNIHKTLGGRKILTALNIDIKPGTITTIIGPSGSGKTTLLKAISLLDPPDEGDIVVGDKEFSFPGRYSDKEMPWPLLTVVFQQLFLWPHLTLRQNITFPVRKRPLAEWRAQFEMLVEMLGMADFVDRFPNETSLGQRQRASLARALILNPKYLLLDEITSALDVEQVSRVLAYLDELKQKGVGILVITHLLGFAKKSSDQIVFLDRGEIIESGTPEMLDHPKRQRVRRFLSVVGAAS